MIESILINGFNIPTVKREIEYVPIKPICTALGMNFTKQINLIIDDEFLQGKMKLVSAPEYELRVRALPLPLIYGWLLTIDTNDVNPNNVSYLIDVKLKCHKALSDHFTSGESGISFT